MRESVCSKLPLSLDNVFKSFGSTEVLQGVNMELSPGSITGLLGRNGAGKSTLIRASLGLVQLDQGRASLFGHHAWDCPAEVRKRMGYVPQTFTDMAWLRVGTGLKLIGSFYPKWDQEMVDRYLDEWSVPTMKKIGNLSHGQQQKVAILMAIGHRPDLLVLDEPVASLDPAARQQFLRTLLMLNDELNQTILFSSHITTDIERVAADVAILDGGKICFQGPLSDLKEQIQCLYLRAGSYPFDQSLIEGFISSRVDGDRLQVWVRDWDKEKDHRLGEQLGMVVHSEQVGLEELFMGLTS